MGLCFNFKYQISNSCSDNLLTMDFPEAMQQNTAHSPFPPHTGTPHPKCTCGFNRPWCLSLNRIRASTELFIQKFLILMVTPISSIWTSQLQSPYIYGPPTLQNKSRRHMTKIVSCNPPQYKSHHHNQHLINHHKQDWSLLALTSVYKIKKKFSPSASDHEFGPAPTPPLPSHILFHSSHKIQGETFHLWGHKKKSWTHFLAPKIIGTLICIRKKKMTS